jgi:glucose/arabinose dehydrogenase
MREEFTPSVNSAAFRYLARAAAGLWLGSLLLGACDGSADEPAPQPATPVRAAPVSAAPVNGSESLPPPAPASAPEPTGEPLAVPPPAGAPPPADAVEIRPTALGAVDLVPVFPGLTFERMVGMQFPNGDPSRLYVVLQEGRIVSIANDQSADSHRVFLDITDRVSRSGNEEGLLGLAFDPQFQDSGHFYVYYSAAGPRRSILSRFTASGGLADPGSERVVLEVGQPYSNHNGGEIAFGPDGYLYVGLGDGGSAGDPMRHGQNKATVLGSILRIDVATLDEHGRYAVPPDNPFADDPQARGEIWAWGLRNPWRFSFDRLTGELWTADVGQNQYEEIDLILPGANYGWNLMEGFTCYGASDCGREGLTLPVVEYGRADGCSVTGGYVYRGSRLQSLYGAYIYGDFCSGKIWALRYEAGSVVAHALIADTDLQIASFAEGPDGEIYALSFTGAVYGFRQADSRG